MKTNENIPESYPDALQKLSRKERGELLATQKQDEIKRSTDGFKVPSQTQEKTYTVKIGKQWKCTCPDYQQQESKCKHQWAVELKLTEKLDKNGNTLQKVAEARKHDGQNWTAYNAAQTNEQQLFRNLLSSLTDTVKNPEQGNGRPSKDLGDMVFNSALKVYTGFSLRRYESLMENSLEDNHIEDKCAYNTISHYMNKEEMTEILHDLIRMSAAPLTSVETGFAADSSGFSTSTFGKFCEHKHSEGKEVRKWVKAHIMAGTNTNIVTAVELNIGAEGDAPNFQPLLEKTAEHFNVKKVSADKAYSSRDIHELVDELGAEAYIPFKDNSSGKARGSQAWKKMYHKFQYEPHKFWPEYKKRNNVETSFHMIKSKFSEDVKSRKERSQINEVLLKILCHNICVVIQEIHELGLEPEF